MKSHSESLFRICLVWNTCMNYIGNLNDLLFWYNWNTYNTDTIAIDVLIIKKCSIYWKVDGLYYVLNAVVIKDHSSKKFIPWYTGQKELRLLWLEISLD